jgi:hypothetical protein
MSARRIAVLVGSHDPAYFARYTQPDRPSEAAVLTALRTQLRTSEASRLASASHTDHRRSFARHAGGRAETATRREHAPDPGGPRRISVFAGRASEPPIRQTRARILARRTASA